MKYWQKVLAGAIVVSVCAVPTVGVAKKEGAFGGLHHGQKHEKGYRGMHGAREHDRAGDAVDHGSVFDALITLAVEKYAPDTAAAWTTAVAERDRAKNALKEVLKQLKDAKVRPPKDAAPDKSDHEVMHAQKAVLVEAIRAKDATKASAALVALRTQVTEKTTQMVQRIEALKKALPVK